MPLIEARDLWKTYVMGADEIHALRGVSIDIERGEYVAIMGPSGSGKSTLMNLIGCLDTPSRGTYLLNGKQVSQMKDDELAEVASRLTGLPSSVRATTRDAGVTRQLFAELARAAQGARRGSVGLTVFDTRGVPIAWWGAVSEIPRADLIGRDRLMVSLGPLGPSLIRIDGIVLEAHMSPPDGIELTRQTRQSGFNQRTPVVMISGDNDPSLLARTAVRLVDWLVAHGPVLQPTRAILAGTGAVSLEAESGSPILARCD